MLKLKYLFENYDLAKEALTHWAHDEAGLDALLTRFRISSNAIYPFRQAGALCFLRLMPVEEKQRTALAGEIEFLQYLAARDYPALRILPPKEGAPFLQLDTRWGSWYAMAFSGVAGVPMEDARLCAPVLTAYGAALGRLHALSADFTPKTKRWSYADALCRIQQVLTEYHAPSAAFEELEQVGAALARLPVSRETFGLVHYDFEPDNVFYDAETGLCPVIDFDDSMYHWYALDVEQVFDSLCELLEGDALEQGKAAFLAGYRTCRAYTPEMDATRPLMRRFIDLYAYARLIRCVDETFENEPEWLVALRKKLNAAIRQKEQHFSAKA